MAGFKAREQLVGSPKDDETLTQPVAVDAPQLQV
jgi:hypothetical protein